MCYDMLFAKLIVLPFIEELKNSSICLQSVKLNI